MFLWDKFDMLQWWSVYDSESPSPPPLLYLEESGNVGKQTAAKVFYENEICDVLTKHEVAIKDETGLVSWGCGSQKHHNTIMPLSGLRSLRSGHNLDTNSGNLKG